MVFERVVTVAGLGFVLVASSDRTDSTLTPADAAAARVKGGTGLCWMSGVSRESFSVNEGITSALFALEFFNLVRDRRL